MENYMCSLCKNSSSERIILFNTETFIKCYSILEMRRKFSLKFSDVVLPATMNETLGYHRQCYKNITALNKKYKKDLEEPSLFTSQLNDSVLPHLSEVQLRMHHEAKQSSKMEWSNENVIRFIELVQGEPCIWDPKSWSHKNKKHVNDAWVKIKKILLMPYSIKELKKKRNNLLTKYRECLKKIKESTDTDEIYKPSWFAFDALHKYMGAIYNRPAKCIEAQTPQLHRSKSRESDIERSNRSPLNKHNNSTIHLLQVKKPMDDAFSIGKERCLQQSDENDLLGQLLAQKLKKMNEKDRLMLTHEIQSLVLKYEMKARSLLKYKSASSHTSTSHIYVPSPSPDFETQNAYDDITNMSH